MKSLYLNNEGNNWINALYFELSNLKEQYYSQPNRIGGVKVRCVWAPVGLNQGL
jgi:hypothetical protein